MKVVRNLVLVVTLITFMGCRVQEDSSAATDDRPAIDARMSHRSAAINREEMHHYFHQTEKPHAAEWSYAGDTGPKHWGDLSLEYVLARDGQRQSPIDVSGPKSTDLPKLEIDYQPAKIDLVYNGHTIKETEEEGSSFTVGGKTFALKQFHFHAPSEHTVDGRHSAMEMHLVHHDEVGRIAVVGVLINEGAHNNAFDPIWDFLPTEKGKEREEPVTVDGRSLLPADLGYDHYMGSLTTPPCTEDVHWYLLVTPIELSKEQISKFTQIINGNNRPVQALNDRIVTRQADR